MTDQTTASQEEQRALSQDELELANQTRQPALGRLSDKNCPIWWGCCAVRRNRARDIAARQGRRGARKAVPKGTNPAAGNAGTRSKPSS